MAQAVSEESVVEDFKRVADKLETEPTLEQYNEHGEYTQTVIYRHFDSYSALKDMVDYERSRFWIDKEDLLNDLQRVAKELDHTPAAEEYNELGEYSHYSLVRQLDTYNNALREIGCEPNHIRNPTKEQIIAEIQRLGDTEPPKAVDMSNDGKHSIPTVLTKFDTWGDALEAAGYERRVEYGKRITLSCEICDESFEVTPSHTDRRFCSPDCWGTYLSKENVGQDHWRAVERDEYQCEHCGDDYKRVHWRASDTDGEFCSFECFIDSISKDGESRYGEGWNDEKRKRVRELYDRTCQACGLDESVNKAMTGMKLHVHHIIPARQFDCAEERNAVENLVPLCVSCHGKWEGIPLKPVLLDGP